MTRLQGSANNVAAYSPSSTETMSFMAYLYTV